MANRFYLSVLTIAVSFGVLFISLSESLADPMRSPWPDKKTCDQNTNQNVEQTEHGYLTFMGKTYLQTALWVWQHTISRVNGKECTMYPSCSHYAMETVQQHGPIIGFFMAADRVLHEESESKYCRMIKVGDQWLFYDPVSNNDFWWYKNDKWLFEDFETK